MSRSIVRSLVVGMALVAAPAVVEAQACTNTGAASATCNVVATATLTIPHIVSLNINDLAITLETPADWAVFLATPAASTSYTETVISIDRAANAQYDVQIAANAATFTHGAGGVRNASTVSWTLGSSCAAPGTVLSTTPANFVNNAAAGAVTGDLCFTTSFINDLADASMRAGAYTLGVTFTIAAP
jgi:hypothetical protein